MGNNGMTDSKPDRRVGVMGGMGPAATLLFYQMVIEHTVARRDQEHVNLVILNHAAMPDRTQALLEGRRAELLEKLIEDARLLERCGADGLVITCNSSHALADEIQAAVGIPLLNMVRAAAREGAERFLRVGAAARVAVLATDGTLAAGVYQSEMEKAGLLPFLPAPAGKRLVMKLIYEGVKGGGLIDPSNLAAIDAELRAAGCAGAILACTELSVLKTRCGLPAYYLDAMAPLVRETILFAGKEYRA
jgi:aspartate racemase